MIETGISCASFLIKKKHFIDGKKVAYYHDSGGFNDPSRSRRYHLLTAFQASYLFRFCNGGMDSTLDAILSKLLREIPEAIEATSKSLPKEFPAEVSDTILEGMTKRITELAMR